MELTPTSAGAGARGASANGAGPHGGAPPARDTSTANPLMVTGRVESWRPGDGARRAAASGGSPARPKSASSKPRNAGPRSRRGRGAAGGTSHTRGGSRGSISSIGSSSSHAPDVAVTDDESRLFAKRLKHAGGGVHAYTDMHFLATHAYHRPQGLHGQRVLLLVLIGVTAFGVALYVDNGVHYGRKLRDLLAQEAGLWILFPFNFLLLLCALALVHYVSPYVAGSGIPEMKSVLSSGLHLQHFLSPQTLVAKATGLVLSQVGGLSVGREGPFVHLSCIATARLLSLRYFRRFRDNGPRQLAMYAAACAAGVAATFGTPFGGLIFSFEVTGTYYLVKHLSQSLFADAVGALMVRVSADTGFTSLFTIRATSLDDGEVNLVAALLWVILGLCCGLLAGAFNLALGWLIRLRAKHVGASVPRRVAAVLLVSIMSTSLVVAGLQIKADHDGELNSDGASGTARLAEYLSMGHNEIVNDMVSDRNFTASDMAGVALFVPVKLFLTVCSLVLPVPTGVFTPVFATGATLGRLFGWLLETYMSASLWNYSASEAALVGAAGLASGVTCTVSSAVILLELSGTTHLVVPTLLCILAANAISQRLSPSIYETLIESNHLPHLPRLKYSTLDNGTLFNPLAAKTPASEAEEWALLQASQTIARPVEFDWTPPVAPTGATLAHSKTPKGGVGGGSMAAARGVGVQSPPRRGGSSSSHGGGGGEGGRRRVVTLLQAQDAHVIAPLPAQAMPTYHHVCAATVMSPVHQLCVLSPVMTLPQVIRVLTRARVGGDSAQGAHSRWHVGTTIIVADMDLPVVASLDPKSPKYRRLVGSVHARDVVAAVEAVARVSHTSTLEFVPEYFADVDAVLEGHQGHAEDVDKLGLADDISVDGDGGTSRSSSSASVSATSESATGGFASVRIRSVSRGGASDRRMRSPAAALGDGGDGGDDDDGGGTSTGGAVDGDGGGLTGLLRSTSHSVAASFRRVGRRTSSMAGAAGAGATEGGHGTNGSGGAFDTRRAATAPPGAADEAHTSALVAAASYRGTRRESQSQVSALQPTKRVSVSEASSTEVRRRATLALSTSVVPAMPLGGAVLAMPGGAGGGSGNRAGDGGGGGGGGPGRAPASALAAGLGKSTRLSNIILSDADARAGDSDSDGADDDNNYGDDGGDDDDVGVATVVMDGSPMRVDAPTPLPKVDVLFRMLRMSVCFVTHEERLVGSVSRFSLMRSPYYRSSKPAGGCVDGCL